MDLNKHIVTSDTNKPFHSSGYAQVATGNRLGSVANVSFNQRQQIDRNRRTIAGYNRSVIGSTYGALRAKPVITKDTASRTTVAQRPSTPITNTLTANHQSYNPYA